MTWQTLANRGLSLAVALGYLILLGVAGRDVDWQGLIIVGVVLLLPLSLIWFADTLSGFGVGMYVRWSRVTGPSPGWMICAIGWLFLLSPLLITLIQWAR